MPDPERRRPAVRAVVLAAGAARRFGSDKLLADLDGRPVLQHVLDRLAEAGIDDPVVVLTPGREAAAHGVAWRAATPVVNEHPEDGLASSLKVGWAAALAATPGPDAVLVVLGDQPRVSPAVVRALAEAPVDPGRPLVAPRYRDESGPNPLRIEASAAALVAGTAGDRGLGPVVAASTALVRWLDVEASNPDVDVPAELEVLAAPVTVANESREIALSMDELRAVASYAAESAQGVLEIFETAHPADSRPRDAIDAAWAFARGGKRGKTLRDTAWGALSAAGEAATAAAGDAARAAMLAASAAYLHPLASAHQVKHILGAAAQAARAAELAAGDDRAVGAEYVEEARRRAGPIVVDVLGRYPAAAAGGGRVGELLRDLDAALRAEST